MIIECIAINRNLMRLQRQQIELVLQHFKRSPSSTFSFPIEGDERPREALRLQESAVRPSANILFLLLLRSKGTHLDALVREKTSFDASGRVVTVHHPTSSFLILCIRNFRSPSFTVPISSSTSLNFWSKRLHLDDKSARSAIQSCSGRRLERHLRLQR